VNIIGLETFHSRCSQALTWTLCWADATGDDDSKWWLW
jgi:hypothetical protein